MRYLITGINGFIGRHLAARLRQEPGAVVLGTGRRQAAAVCVADYLVCDLTCRTSTARLVAWARADVVFHLAGRSNHGDWRDIERHNLHAYHSLWDALRQVSARPVRLLVVGSAAELGDLPAESLPATEATPCRPLTPYGRSKHAITRHACEHGSGRGLVSAVVARTFNLVGPRLDSRLALGSFAQQCVECLHGRRTTIHCGPLVCRRDYVDVRDAVEAYLALVRSGEPGQIYNVCSGVGYQMAHLLDRMLTILAIRPEIVTDASAAPAGPSAVVGDATKTSRLTGWRSITAIDDSLASLLAHAMERGAVNMKAA